MKKLLHRLLFDKADYTLANNLEELIHGSRSQKQLRKLFDPCFHPRGIKELAAPMEIRVITAMLSLLDSHDQTPEALEQRLSALRSLRDEIVDGNPGELRLNAARVLMQIMKELIRERHDPIRQLQLAHDLRTALLAPPRFIRRQLKKYFLLEMPEEWNQISFDDHVHDAGSKGRKTPTHLVMDAWIKGIRQLQVIYYNYVPRYAAEELLRAAEIMGIDLRIGVELTTVYRGRYAEMIWVPRGFSGADDFLGFLDRNEIREFQTLGMAAAEYRKKQLLEVLDDFNRTGLPALNAELEINLPPLRPEEFLASVRYGQPSPEHLSELIAGRAVQALRDRRQTAPPSPDDTGAAKRFAARLNRINGDYIREQYLVTARLEQPPADLSQLPEINRYSRRELIERLRRIATGFRLTLNLSGLKLADVLEILFECDGRITHLELFNLKDHLLEESCDIEAINRLRQALNQGNVIHLKQIIREVIRQLQDSEQPDRDDRIAQLRQMLRELPRLLDFYAHNPLLARLGSDSAGRAGRTHGMGLVVIDSLPAAIRHRLRRETLPVTARVHLCRSYRKRTARTDWGRHLLQLLQCCNLGLHRQDQWVLDDGVAELGAPGNIVSLGGSYQLSPPGSRRWWRRRNRGEFTAYLNSNLKMLLKVMAGLIPAFLSFYLTRSWWVLAYGGAFIWLGITGWRNILQAVLGGGGWKRSSLLKWNDFISWQRVADSLMYTGISVPLLDYVVKTLLLQRGLKVTAEINPIATYTVIALANGAYINWHNLLRGFTRTAIVGNWFRTFFSIPLAIGFSMAFGGILSLAGVVGVAVIVQSWAAVISKLASDCVAGVIEGYADRVKNLSLRRRDYRLKLQILFAGYARLEIMFPEQDVMTMLKSPKALIRSVAAEENHLEKMLIINAVDLLYFWMYQPQARNTLARLMAGMSTEERQILVLSQYVLRREKEISRLFIDGVVGKNFSRPLAFYLDYFAIYLTQLENLNRRLGPPVTY
ncbi:MAG: hypothetical protein PHQ27_05870 [Victivallales bacterium]|nr:hypothetical protein [Victivallales bacterium]